MKKNLKNYVGPDEVVPASQIQQEAQKCDSSSKIISGIPTLDIMLDYFSLGEVVVLSGPPGHGKTSFARFLLSKFGNSGYKALYFGKEGGVSNFFKKFPDPLPEFYMSKEYIKSSIEWLEDRIIEGQQKFLCNIAFVDHLHYILDIVQMQKENTSIYVGMFMRKLIAIAKEHNILIFLLAHTNKEVFSRAPNLSDIRDSSFIAQEADVVMFIWRQMKTIGDFEELEFDENKCKLGIMKNRREGNLKTIKMVYNHGTFTENNYG